MEFCCINTLGFSLTNKKNCPFVSFCSFCQGCIKKSMQGLTRFSVKTLLLRTIIVIQFNSSKSVYKSPGRLTPLLSLAGAWISIFKCYPIGWRLGFQYVNVPLIWKYILPGSHWLGTGISILKYLRSSGKLSTVQFTCRIHPSIHT